MNIQHVQFMMTLVCVNSVLPVINQSINQIANIPGKARLSGMTAKLVFNSKINETVP